MELLFFVLHLAQTIIRFMLSARKYAKKGSTRYLLCLAICLFMLFQGNTNPQNFNFFAEKTTENKKEESRTEKETEDEKGGEQNQIGKSKKIKRQLLPPPDLAADLVFVFETYRICEWSSIELDLFGHFAQTSDLFAALPRYLHFHSLVFYEI